MDHYKLALEFVNWAELDVQKEGENVLNPLQHTLEQLVTIERRSTQKYGSSGDQASLGFGIIQFQEQRFYSVKLGNLSRDKLGVLGLGGAVVAGGISFAKLVTSGSLLNWPGAGAMVAILLALAGRGKSFVTSFGLDEATTLDMAWRQARKQNNYGFYLVTVDELEAQIGNVEAIYKNAGFTKAKLTNALNRLRTIGMIKEAGAGRYQLIEKIMLSDSNQLLIRPA